MTDSLQATSYKLQDSNGFTLIEMIVVISIFTIMTGVVLANLPQFRERTALQLVAQKMSITIREAQVYGVGVKSSSATVFPSHGINFGPVASNKKSYVLFADSFPPGPPVGNNKYDGAAEKVTQYDLTGTVEISLLQLCNLDCVGVNSLFETEIATNGLNIVFDRPKTEANFTDSSGSTLASSYAKITLVSTRSLETRTVWVWNTGQISVKTP